MNLYDDIIIKCNELIESNKSVRHFKKKDITSWKSEKEQEFILKNDMAYELGGTMFPALSMLAFTSDMKAEDEVVVVGKDLSEIKSDVPYARITFLSIDDSGWTDNQKAYSAMRRIDYTRYHVYPHGFMMRISTSASREPVRVSKEAIAEGLDFKSVGGTLIDAYHKHEDVKAVRIIFITDDNFPYQKLSEYAHTDAAITKSLNTIFNSLLMDCKSCSQKSVCDEVEGMRDLHKTYLDKSNSPKSVG